MVAARVSGTVVDGLPLTEPREIELFEQATGRKYNRAQRRSTGPKTRGGYLDTRTPCARTQLALSPGVDRAGRRPVSDAVLFTKAVPGLFKSVGFPAGSE